MGHRADFNFYPGPTSFILGSRNSQDNGALSEYSFYFGVVDEFGHGRHLSFRHFEFIAFAAAARGPALALARPSFSGASLALFDYDWPMAASARHFDSFWFHPGD